MKKVKLVSSPKRKKPRKRRGPMRGIVTSEQRARRERRNTLVTVRIAKGIFEGLCVVGEGLYRAGKAVVDFEEELRYGGDL